MRAIGGICHLDDRPLDRQALDRLGDATRVLVSHRRNHWLGNSVGLVCTMAPREANRPTVVRWSSHDGARFVVVFDGRIDNRGELIADVGRGRVGQSSDDAELLLAAYVAWGDTCASKLIGDFAFGLWDERARRLVCARDPLGVRPLYLLVGNGLVGFATQLRQLLAICPQTPAVEMEYVADRLALGVDRPDSGCTLYRGLSRLEPGYCLIAERGRVHIDRYWEWANCDMEPRGDSGDWVERFRDRFSDAVASRMSGPGRIWADLSGGLDSSSIVSVAAEQPGRSRLSTISVVFSESKVSDEREWVEMVAGAVDVEPHEIDGDAHHPFSRLLEAVQHWEEPHGAAAFFGVHERYARLMGEGGVPVLLSGIGAEAVVLSKHQEPVHLADLLRHGRLLRWWRELDRWQRALRKPLSNVALRYALRPLLGRGGISYGWTPGGHDWIAESFTRKWNLRDRIRRGNMPRAGRGAADQWHVERIGWITGFLLRGYLEKACDIRYPFLHRPLVELALSMPWSLKAVPGEPKAILRRAMKGILPERVRRRTQNASTGHAVYNGLRKEWPVLEKLVDSSVLVELGAVDRERLRTALHLARQGHAPDLGGLLSTLTLDAWLQHAFHGRQRPGANAEAA